MTTRGFFIAGTDTGVGKTRATLYLLKLLQTRGLQAIGLKPVATGGVWRDGNLVNEDALALQQAGSVVLPYATVNPWLFEPPAAPHIAAARAGRALAAVEVAAACMQPVGAAEVVLVEGVGGWLVPLNARETMADVARLLGLPVILVVALRLGCLNHAALTCAAIRSSGSTLAGWVASRITADFAFPEENLAALADILGGSPIGVLPYRPGDDRPVVGDLGSFEGEAILRALATCDKFPSF